MSDVMAGQARDKESHSPGEQVSEVPVDQLRRTFDPATFTFKSTSELPALDHIIGQDRAVRAVSFGIDIRSSGYHIYALGSTGTGKSTTIQKFLQSKAAGQTVPDDWCYVNNFDDPDKPCALRLLAGKGCEFCHDLDALVEELKSEVPRAFESEQYARERENIGADLQRRTRSLFEELDSAARAKGFSVVQTPNGVLLAPVVNGNVLPPDKFAQLDENTQREIESKQQELQGEFRETMRRLRQPERDAHERIHDLDRRIVSDAVDHLLNDFKHKYGAYDLIVAFIDQVHADILDKVEALKQIQEAEPPTQAPTPQALMQQQSQVSYDQYRANLIVDNCNTRGAPVIVESNPTYYNLMGRVEHQAQFGALVTNFTMIRGGSLHHANGGYLLVETRDILSKPFAWDALKRALRTKQVKMETMGQEFSIIPTRSLEPEPIPLDVKVVILGDPSLYYLLYHMDDDFQELFKVKADFSPETDWDDETSEQYARFIATICRGENLRHFDPSGVAKVLEHSARLASSQKKLATRFGDVCDLIRQASYWAVQNGHDLVQGSDVQQAIHEKIYRSNRIEEQLNELIQDGTIAIDTEGVVVGQINGISVLPMGDYTFGKPSRITARTYAGNAGVVNIDREATLGGRIHNKGVMIIAGYLGGKYANEMPLAMSASVTFEQIYEEVEGDSASSAELYAVLSSLSGYPVKQNLAVTGSVNQHGQVQAIGGVNEKIEGFYDVCHMKGLTGDQGVLIPQSNVSNLMLREDVVAAVQAGQFHIYPVRTIEEGIALLTGHPTGERQQDGTYPEGSVNRAVHDRLHILAERVKDYDKQIREKEFAGTDRHKNPEPKEVF